MKARMIILAAPSGAGKSSFVDRITREMPQLRDTVTYTTRTQRSGESQGNPYFFVSREEFLQKIEQDFFIEWAKVHTNLYGTPFYQIEDAWSEGRCVIMDVDVQGAQTFKEKFPDAVTIFILPPSIEELKRRIQGRDAQVPADLDVRMENARKEIEKADLFDFQIVNDEFEKSYGEFKKIVEKLIT